MPSGWLLHMLGQEVTVYYIQQLVVYLYSICNIGLNGVVIFSPGYTWHIKITSEQYIWGRFLSQVV